MKKILIPLLATALLWSGVTTAQKKPSIDIVVEKTNSVAHGCGVSDSSLKSFATLTLRNNGISVDDLALQFISIGTTVLDLKNGCAVSLTVQFHAAMTRNEVAEVLRGMMFKPRSGVSLAICEKTNLLTGPSYDMSQRVGAALEEQIKLCLGELIY